MIQKDSALNQDLNSGHTVSSPAGQHMESPGPDVMVTAKTEAQRLNRLGMVSAVRGQHRMKQNEERNPTSTIFSK